MAQLLFFDEGHEYVEGDRELASVSEVIRFITREVYSTVIQAKMDMAADRGSRVHKVLEALDKYGEVEADDDIIDYAKAYLQFRKEHEVSWEVIELPISHSSLDVAGTLDRVGMIDGEFTIVDLKTSYAINKPLVTAQLNFYRMIWESKNDKPIDKLYVLHLHKDGTYKLVPVVQSDDIPMACYTIHQALKPKRKRKKVGADDRGD